MISVGGGLSSTGVPLDLAKYIIINIIKTNPAVINGIPVSKDHGDGITLGKLSMWSVINEIKINAAIKLKYSNATTGVSNSFILKLPMAI